MLTVSTCWYWCVCQWGETSVKRAEMEVEKARCMSSHQHWRRRSLTCVYMCVFVCFCVPGLNESSPPASRPAQPPFRQPRLQLRPLSLCYRASRRVHRLNVLFCLYYCGRQKNAPGSCKRDGGLKPNAAWGEAGRGDGSAGQQRNTQHRDKTEMLTGNLEVTSLGNMMKVPSCFNKQVEVEVLIVSNQIFACFWLFTLNPIYFTS